MRCAKWRSREQRRCRQRARDSVNARHLERCLGIEVGKQTGQAALACAAANRNGRYVVVVDEDIDPTNMKEVLWAMMTRVDPPTNIDIVDGCWSTPLDPRMPPEKRENKDHTNGRAIFYAVRPFPWKDKFPKVSRSSRELREKTIAKFKGVIPFPGA